MRALDLFGRVPLARPGVMYLTLCTAAALSQSSAYACPPDTVFSAFNGRGICAKFGGGAQPVAICYVTRGSCPHGFTLEHKNSDPSRSYCCPISADHPSKAMCEDQCNPASEERKSTGGSGKSLE
jgi:hypothetical protein